MNRRSRTIALYALAGVLLSVWAFPVLWALLTSFKSERDVLAYPPVVIFTPTLANYREVLFGASSILPNLWSSLVVTGATTLLTQAYRPAEKARVQGFNDMIVFVTMITSSASSGILLNANGWELLNYLSIPFVILMVFAVGWLVLRREGMPVAV